jgi:hypothetical protein
MGGKEKALRDSFEQLKSQGLVDIKFSFGPLAETTTEEVCASVSAVLKAVENHEYEDMPSAPKPVKKA